MKYENIKIPIPETWKDLLKLVGASITALAFFIFGIWVISILN